MNLLSAIATAMGSGKAELPSFLNWNGGVALYTPGKEDVYLNQGYNKNGWLYAIVSKSARKFAQIPWYHYRLKPKERKTWGEYTMLTKGGLRDPKAKAEAIKMRTKAVEQVRTESKLQAFLDKPNNYQSGAAFREQLYGFRELSGEANTWYARTDVGQPPTSAFLIPKSLIALLPGLGPWDIRAYQIELAGQRSEAPKEDVLMWKYPGYAFDALTLIHMRGQSPLDAGLLALQALNEGSAKLVAMNRNQGIAGMATSESLKMNEFLDSPARATMMRKQFDAVVNDSSRVGSIGVMAGKWDYHEMGLNAEQLKMIEQTDMQFKTLCNIYDVPWQLFGNADTYENRKQYKRDFVYDKIAPDCYGLRDLWNATLVPEFGYDNSVDVVDCDLMALPELVEDQKDLIAALANAWWLSPNQRLEAQSYDRSTDANMDKIYMPGTLRTMEDVNSETGAPLDAEQQLLND